MKYQFIQYSYQYHELNEPHPFNGCALLFLFFFSSLPFGYWLWINYIDLSSLSFFNFLVGFCLPTGFFNTCCCFSRLFFFFFFWKLYAFLSTHFEWGFRLAWFTPRLFFTPLLWRGVFFPPTSGETFILPFGLIFVFLHLWSFFSFFSLWEFFLFLLS